MHVKPKTFQLKRKFRFALVGCGRISANHFEAFQNLSEYVELAALCDISATALEAAKQKTGVSRGYARIEDLLADSRDIDVVTLCTPSGLHSQQSILCARAGKHVVSEKPMATHWADGLKMLKEAEEAKTRLFVVKQNRFNPTIELVKRAIQSNRFGKLYMGVCNVFWQRPQSYYDQASWRGTKKLDGGAFMNQASHYVDQLIWLLGPIESIFCYSGTLARKIETEDTGSAAIRWKSGAIGSMNVTMLTYPKNLEGSITLIGENGTVRVGGIAMNKIEKWEFKEFSNDDKEVEAANYETASVYGNGHTPYYRNVIEALATNAPSVVDGHEGLKSLEVLSALQQSMSELRPVGLPLKRDL